MPDKKNTVLEKNPLWYKNGVIYEVHVRAFQDSDGDGTGDFRGLTSRLDYLRDLGITAIWLLPFYPSPLKDDGYDIADYYGVHPMYGTLSDFKEFLNEAHQRGLRVITELVLNHTSDQHPWFQRARRSPPGSVFRDFYVWNDTAEKYKGTRVIFKDTEISNWTWDAVAGAFFWHRFFSHQPDLNFYNPAVHAEMIKVVDFWLDLGVDGVRLDAVPYLYEREGTGCENLEETHEYLKILRKHVDEKYRDRMLLAEANQWPEDAVAYFGQGKGDECHMAFHFPLMPRLFMALRMEDRVPIVDILEQTPPIPETAQWALFLRNHDELTLEMVTDEERDYMYRMYAHVPQARLNLGIRRRLAPLVGNDRNRIQLLTGILLSLPGTPVIYYGDEIGMGENIYLGDRNGVRTPMQWSADKNAGFSRADPQSLYLPINLAPENHYEAVNVEVQERNNYSLLWWMRRLIALYKRCEAFGRGTIEFLHPDNRKIFACIRRYRDETILVVANLSRFVQAVELDLAKFKSMVPIELFGRSEFPPVTEQPYFLTLGPHAFYWMSLEAKVSSESKPAPQGADASPIFNLVENGEELLEDRHHLELERALQGWLPSRPWFAGNGRTIKSVRLQERISIPLPSSDPKIPGTANAFLTFLLVEYVQANEPDTYVLPLAFADGENAKKMLQDSPEFVIARLKFGQQAEMGILYDAIINADFQRALLRSFSGQTKAENAGGKLEASASADFGSALQSSQSLEPVLTKSLERHDSIVFGDQYYLKLLRGIDLGINPDLEVLQCLSAKKFPYVPPVAGLLKYQREREEATPLAMVTSFIPKAKNIWEYTLDTLGKFYERVQTLPPDKRTPQIPSANVSLLAATPLSEEAKGVLDTYIESARLIGQRTAAMHLALASETEDRNFSPEPFTPHAQRGLFQSIRNITKQNLELLSRDLKKLSPEAQAQAEQVLALEPEIMKRLRDIYERRLDATRIRIHGDYHLGAIVHTGKDFIIVDFEGEPTIPPSERRLKRSPLQDVASMMRSFYYAVYAALVKQMERGTAVEAQLPQLILWSRFWARWVSALFYQGYLQAAGPASFLPPDEADLRMMMDVFLLRKAVYELGFELNNRPGWTGIPLQGILELINEQNIAADAIKEVSRQGTTR